MGEQSAKLASAPTGAVFLSHASQDAEAAHRICEALRAAGVEVWFDQNELRGGDAWDRRIRQQIRDCVLFLPIISARTQARAEGYFRLEWHLAEQRTHLIGRQRAFLVPVCIDDTPERDADVPDAFLAVQWMRLPNGEATAAFIERVQRLTSPGAPLPSAAPFNDVEPATDSSETGRQPVVAQKPSGHRSMNWLKLAVPVLMAVLAAIIFIPPWQNREHARNVLLPAIQETTSKMVRSDGHLLDMALEAERYLPNNPTLTKLWPVIAKRLSIETEPAGAEVFWKDYATPNSEWRSAGVTPLKGVRVAYDHLRLEIRKKGYQTVELAGPRWDTYVPTGEDVDRYVLPRLKLDPLGSLPNNMVRIPASTTDMNIVGLEKYGNKAVPEFVVDKFEVTNRQFKAFVDAGGYSNIAYWQFPVVEAGKVIPLAVALAKFKDQTLYGRNSTRGG